VAAQPKWAAFRPYFSAVEDTLGLGVAYPMFIETYNEGSEQDKWELAELL